MTESKIPPRKAQTSMILIVLILIIFAALAVFLMSLTKMVSQEDYMDLYVNNLMLSIMRTDTGYSDSNCKLISDTVFCALTESSWTCGTSGMFDLVEYIKEELSAGKSEPEIRNALLNQGWYSEEINEAFLIASGLGTATSESCLDFANRSLSDYMDAFELISKNYRYLFEVTTHEYCFKEDEECMMLRFGDESLKSYRSGRVKTANYVIQKSMRGNQYNLKVRLYIARKS